MPVTTTSKTSSILISHRFERVVVLHILKNMLRHTDVQVPLLMGIHGPSGEGKTIQCETILKRMGVKRFLISGGQMESPVAGAPAQLIRSTYIKASESIRGGECSMAVVLVNDIDTGLGSAGNTPSGNRLFSVNQLMVFGELMHLVDYPNSVENKETLRVPIVITGNDFTRLYEPLVRAGRMTAFEWIPSLDERAEIVGAIFPELTPGECYRLIAEINEILDKEQPDKSSLLPIAFFSHLRSTLLDEDLWKEVERTGLHRTVDEIIKDEEPNFSFGLDYDRVLSKGVELAHSGALINHIIKKTEVIEGGLPAAA
ncbi:MAG TPA: AAA family ATPase [Anaerolineales bacterium]|nr:AAA family ATPase [Anaerolineales bacterium]